MCYGCRHPLSEPDREDPSFEEGVSCPRCIGNLTPEKAAGLRMRHSQMVKTAS